MFRQILTQLIPLAAILCLSLTACQQLQKPQSNAGAKTVLDGPYQVIRVVDGDTLIIDQEGQEQRIRLIGVDTPETVHPDSEIQCYGPEVSDYTKNRLENTAISLEYDQTQGETDKYGRTLAYVWTEDGDLLNLELLENGFATEYTYSAAYTYQQAFRAAEKQAKNEMVGLWSACQ